MAVTDTLTTVGISTFGSTMPLLAPSWSSSTPTVTADGLGLQSGDWVAPLAGYARTADQAAKRSGVLLRKGDGSPVATTATVISLYPEQYLRLARLYALILETGTRPEAAQGLPARPVPAHIVLDATVPDGGIDPGDTLAAGTLSFHDRFGQPLDPIAVAAAFVAFMTAHPPLQFVTLGGTPASPPPLAAMVTALLPAGQSDVRVRLIGADGKTAAATHLTGLTAASAGLFTAPAGGTIGKDAVGAAFPADESRALVVGLATTGSLGDSVVLPALPQGVTLARDYFALRVLDLRGYLLGTPATTWAGTRIEPRPAVRRGEAMTFLADGNDVLGAAGQALGGAGGPAALAESIVVAPRIDGSFPAPVAAGDGAHWPAFPPLGALTAAAAGPVPIALRAGLTPAAAFLSGGTQTPAIDVVLPLNGLPVAASVRAFNRKFSADAVESRGDGAGGIADGSGIVRLLLRDPLGLQRPGQPPPTSVPGDPLLHVDVVVVKRTGEARIFGDVTVPITGTAPAPTPGTNSMAAATRRAVCGAGILGPGGATVPATGTSAVAAALTLLSEGTPRDAPRLPGMARRDLLVAGLAAATGGSWQSVLGAGRLGGELHNGLPRLGGPGGTGGRETQAVGVATAGGRLAYDIARAGLRRTTSIVTRLVPLAGTPWDEPPEPSGTAAGTFAGAVLQSVAAACETPELSLLRTLNIVDPDDPNFPHTFDALVDATKGWATSLVGQLPSGLPASATSKLNDLITKMDDLKDNAPNDESTKERIFNELLREIAASGWGRRDAQWSLQAAFGRAERFIYIETPGMAATAASGATDPFAVDLFAALTARLNANPALHVAICLPREPDFPFGFNPWRDLEAASRHSIILGLPSAAATAPLDARVVAFHPIGFPGRPSRLESTVVIVDDAWAMVGSSTLRRRGLAFDGGADMVTTDLSLTDGRSAAIAAFRRRLQAARLGVPAPAAPPALPASSWVRLSDGVDACHEIRDMLRGGGLGRIERLAPPEPDGRPAAPGPIDVVNPDGETVDLPGLLVALVLAGAASA